MRQIKFRGKRPNSGKWIHGYLYQDGMYSYIMHPDFFKTPECSCEVMTETVGQYTGLKDKNGVEIYEGDILDTDNRHDIPITVNWSKRHASFGLIHKAWVFTHYFGEAVEPEDVEIIGNIHDRPELI